MMANKLTTVTLEQLSKAELIAFIRLWEGREPPQWALWRARWRVASDQAEAVGKAHAAATTALAPYRIALQAAVSDRQYERASREFKARSAETELLWQKLRAAWKRRDQMNDQSDRWLRDERRNQADTQGDSDAA